MNGKEFSELRESENARQAVGGLLHGVEPRRTCPTGRNLSYKAERRWPSSLASAANEFWSGRRAYARAILEHFTLPPVHAGLAYAYYLQFGGVPI